MTQSSLWVGERVCWSREFCRQYAPLEIVSWGRVYGLRCMWGYLERHVSDSIVGQTKVSFLVRTGRVLARA